MYDVFVAYDALSFPTCYVGMAFYSLCNVTTACCGVYIINSSRFCDVATRRNYATSYTINVK